MSLATEMGLFSTSPVFRVIIEDSRVIGLYVYGSQTADEYSDVDLYKKIKMPFLMYSKYKTLN
ncbi:MAG: hypothetical protein KAS63_10170 [Candidatus Heimdallarchaeota archaeon]|nr:hypothetical protein [Candidatus Heimdallarchaeota archaeon]MCK4955718.1 hypothetical protein [Candidatus Heimdallarchaeota archaeon]